MVGNHSDGHIHLLALAISVAREARNGGNQRCKHIGVVVRLLALQSHAQALKTHTGVDHLSRQRLQRAVGLAVILHEHKVPNLNHLRIVLVHQRSAVYSCAFLIASEVYMNLGARAARAGVAHLPEIVMSIAIDNVAGGQMLLPIAGRLIVALQALRCISLKHSGIQTLRIQLQHIHQIFPCPVYGILLEIVAKRPVAKHLKHGVVISVVAHFLEVVVLSTHTQTFLRVGHPSTFRSPLTENNIFKLIHSRICKHKCRVVLDHHRSRRYYLMTL